MAKAYSDFDSESYPWDSVWEYILDDRNFEDAGSDQETKKKSWSIRQQKGAEDGFDSDSAYDEDDNRRVREPKPNLKPSRPILHQPKQEIVEVEKPKRNSRFWHQMKQRLRRKKKSQETTSRATEIPREKYKVRFQDDEKDYQSDFGLSRVPSFLQRTRRDDVSVTGNQSVSSETSSVLRLLQWGRKVKQDEEVHDFENLDDEDDVPDEVSVMESIFNFEETRSDFDVDDRNRYRAKQKWRSSSRRTSQERSPVEFRRSLSDLFDTRETGSVQSSHSRRSRNSRHVPEESSVDFLMETKGGYLIHVPKSVAFSTQRFRRRTSFQGY